MEEYILESKITPELKQFADLVENYRKTRTHIRAPMSSELWMQAIKLSKKYSTYIVCSCSGLNYGNLSKRVGEASRAKPPAKSQEFIPIPMASVIPESPELEIEIVNLAGQRLRLKGVSLDASLIIKQFMEAQ